MSDSRNCLFTDVGSFRLNDIQSHQRELRSQLNLYQKAPSVQTLKDFVYAGWEAYRSFLSGFQGKSNGNAKRFWESCVGSRRSHGAPMLWITEPDDITIPISLYYLRNPSDITNWDDFPSVAQDFAGVDFPIRKIYQRKQRLDHNTEALCRQDENPRIVHSVDNSLSHAAYEAESWPLLMADVISTLTAKSLVDAWTKASPAAHIVHCSCHMKKNSHGRSYLTCANEQKLYINDLREGGAQIDNPPFVFINSCNGGVLDVSDRDNFVWSLFPEQSIGFISTICQVKDELANDFSQEFYRNFHGGAGVLLALQQAISTLVLEQRKLGALAYTLWEADPHLVLRDAQI